MKITHYQIVREDGLYSLESEVNTFIKYGWQPLGGVQCTTSSFREEWSQAMVKYER